MSRPSVIISCVPTLNGAQQQGMLNLVNDIEQRGFDVYIWADDFGDQLQAYNVAQATNNISLTGKLRRWWYLRQARSSLDKNKWVSRLQLWARAQTNEAAQSHFKYYLAEAVTVFAVLQPAHFICWNPFCCRFGIAYDTAAILGIETAGTDWGYLPDTFILDRMGTQAASAVYNKDPLANRNADDLQAFHTRGGDIFNELQKTNSSIYKQAKPQIPPGFLPDDKKTIKILVLGIGEVDAGAYPPAHRERKGLLPFHQSSYEQAVDIAAVNKNYRVIFKPHPSHNQFKDDLIIDNLTVVNGSPDELIEWADVIFCTGSLELSVMTKGKPLITYGAGLLHAKNISYEINSPGDAEKVIAIALSGPGAEARLTNFKTILGYFDMEYLYNFTGNKNNSVANLLKR